ncbi:MAG: 5-amino-6-(D-ribitylamino)uracil--L-tyrosine 4-hydroxyphenyl transferase CofH [Gammaproteobacteria bacterium]|nr:5-amino-6-(D-ribitylamino)uracil--L-tyrosine 4-hydroxyphenyl transferase CofH [Gammaproteobacteria bacterium]
MIDPGTADTDWQLSRAAAIALCDEEDTGALMHTAAALRDRGHGNVISYSRKVFIPLTRLCRDVCHYCTFATSPRKLAAAFMSLDEVIAVARAGADAGCKEALFTLGDKPELRYRQARGELERLGHPTTLAYVAEAAALVHEETGLLPHLNPGVLDRHEMQTLRAVSVSQGLMLESAAERLCEKGGPHYGSPDKLPAVRLATLRLAGELAVPFTTGILIGIGETRLERVESLLAIRDLHEQHGHIQEIIIQNFRPKPGTPMADAAAPSSDELFWTIAVARLIFGPAMNIQAPPNLSPGQLGALIGAGLNDWGGVSPVTPDHVNPEAPWPHLRELATETANSGKQLTERLAIYPDYALDSKRWLDDELRTPVLRAVDSEGFVWTGPWIAGAQQPADVQTLTQTRQLVRTAAPIDSVLSRACDGQTLSETDVVSLFHARHDEFAAVCDAADRLRAAMNGDAVSYVVNRNINYTNVCYFKCGFCAFSKGRLSQNLRGKPYDLDLDEIGRRTQEAWMRGATEVCMQGGIHPDYSGQNYIDICHAVKAAVPEMHVHAFSPLEVWQGAQTLNLPVADYLAALQEAGLATLPGTAAEVLDDEVRAVICPDKINTAEWLSVVQNAHARGLRTTATIMFGHVDAPRHWAGHLLRIRALQQETGGITEFVPLPFVHMEAPLYLKGLARKGPTLREAVLMHAVARLVLHPHVTNIQTSWVKMGAHGAKLCLAAGANDLGGTLMNESITRAAGGAHGQETTPQHFEELIRDIGRTPVQRTTLYKPADSSRVSASFAAREMAPVVNRPVQRRSRPRQPRQLVRSCVSQ